MTNEEIQYVLFYFGDHDYGKEAGHFTSLIMNAYQIADPRNKSRLRIVFPGLTTAMDTVLNPPLEHLDGMEHLRMILRAES